VLLQPNVTWKQATTGKDVSNRCVGIRATKVHGAWGGRETGRRERKGDRPNISKKRRSSGGTPHEREKIGQRRRETIGTGKKKRNSPGVLKKKGRIWPGWTQIKTFSRTSGGVKGSFKGGKKHTSGWEKKAKVGVQNRQRKRLWKNKKTQSGEDESGGQAFSSRRLK